VSKSLQQAVTKNRLLLLKVTWWWRPNLPHITNRNDYTGLEKGTSAELLAPTLKGKGHDIKIIDLNSGLHGIQIENGIRNHVERVLLQVYKRA
jgi:hypothetical protein